MSNKPITLASMVLATALAAATATATAAESAPPHGQTLAAASTAGDAGAVLPDARPPLASPEERERARKYFTDLPVQDQDGNELRFYSDVLEGRIVLVNFMFANCADACPMATQKMKALAGDLGERLGRDVFFVSISVDPERDAVADMRAFAENQDALMDGWLWLTGEPQSIHHILQKFGAYTGNIDAHSTLMLLGNVPRAHWAKIPPMSSPRHIAAKLAVMTGEL